MKSRGLTNSPIDRIFVGLLGIVFAPLSGLMIYAALADRAHLAAHDWFGEIHHDLLAEVYSVVFTVSMLAIIWAVCAPLWVKRNLQKAASRIVAIFLLIEIICIALTVAAYWLYR